MLFFTSYRLANSCQQLGDFAELKSNLQGAQKYVSSFSITANPSGPKARSDQRCGPPLCFVTLQAIRVSFRICQLQQKRQVSTFHAKICPTRELFQSNAPPRYHPQRQTNVTKLTRDGSEQKICTNIHRNALRILFILDYVFTR